MDTQETFSLALRDVITAGQPVGARASGGCAVGLVRVAALWRSGNAEPSAEEGDLFRLDFRSPRPPSLFGSSAGGGAAPFWTQFFRHTFRYGPMLRRRVSLGRGRTCGALFRRRFLFPCRHFRLWSAAASAERCGRGRLLCCVVSVCFFGARARQTETAASVGSSLPRGGSSFSPFRSFFRQFLPPPPLYQRCNFLSLRNQKKNTEMIVLSPTR